MTRRQVVLNGFGWGLVAGIALIALMYLAGLLFALKPLPQLLNEPLLALMPGWLFGFLIDNLQHAGKVVEEFGLIVAMEVALGAVGAAAALASQRWKTPYLPFVFAGAAWLVTALFLLPTGGSSLLGLNDGPATPIIWAALFAVYAVVLQMGAGPAAAAAVDPGRRRVLGALPLTIGAVGVGLLAWRLVPDWYRAIARPAEAGLVGSSPAITPVSNFYVVSKNFVDPVVDGQAWRLHVTGMVDKPASLSLADLRALPATTEYVTFECISNDVGGNLMSTGAFTGVPLRDLIAAASAQTQASWVGFKARDGFTESLPLGLVHDSTEILVAYELNGAPLPNAHGFPARVVIPGRYGMKQPKWLEEIVLGDHETGGYWEQQGWDRTAAVKTTSRFDAPRDGDILKLGAISLAGVAFAGTRGVSRVEFSTNGGTTWTAAAFDPPLGPLTWVLWRATWIPGSEGAYRLMVRAADGQGMLQDARPASSYPNGAAGYHTIQVSVSK